MDVVLLVTRVALAVVLSVAAVGKLLDRQGSVAAMAGFGVPTRLAGPLAALLPVAELATAALLLPAATATVGAALALSLLAGFSVGIGRALARGERPDCHCFGALHSAPAGPAALARNGVLGLLAVLVLVFGGGPSAIAWIGDISRAEALTLAALVVAAASAAGFGSLALGLLRRHGALLLRVDMLEERLAAEGIEVRPETPAAGLPVGEAAPVEALPGLAALLDRGRDLLLVFTHPDCGPCRSLAPSIERWRAQESVTVATVGPAGDLQDGGDAAYMAFDLRGTPGAVLVDRDGTIASAAATGPDAVEALYEQALLDAGRLRVGDPVPEIVLRGLDGEPIALAEADATVLLWNPSCGFCAQLRDGVRTAERRGTPILVVSSGDPQETLGEGFEGVVALDPDFTVGDLLGTGGTPSAVRLSGGRLVSEPVVGITDVRALLGVLEVVRHG